MRKADYVPTTGATPIISGRQALAMRETVDRLKAEAGKGVCLKYASAGEGVHSRHTLGEKGGRNLHPAQTDTLNSIKGAIINGLGEVTP